MKPLSEQLFSLVSKMEVFEPQMSSVGNFPNLYLLELQWE